MESYYIILSFILFCSCKEEQRYNVVNNQKQNDIVKKDTLEEFVQTVIDDERMNMYLDYLSVDDKSRIILIENKKLGITKKMKIYKFNHLLSIIPYSSIKNKTNINYFNFTKVDYFKDSIYISYYYKLENIECQTYFKKKNTFWKQGDTRANSHFYFQHFQ